MSCYYEIGEKLVIELKSGGVFEGSFVNGCNNRLDLIDVTNNNTMKKGLYSFYTNEIHQIYKWVTKKRKYCEEQSSKYLKYVKTILVDEDEYHRLITMSQNYIFMSVMDSRYFEACDKLSNSEAIGVAVIGAKRDRTTILKLIVMSTWYQVYIFDFAGTSHRQLPEEIQNIFEDSSITKIAHSAQLLCDCLQKMYSIHATNIFDTQIIDLVLYKRETGKCPTKLRSLSECLSYNLNIPISLITDCDKFEYLEWNRRPLDAKKLRTASENVAYLCKLYDFMKKQLLIDVYKGIDDIHSLYVNDETCQSKSESLKVTKAIEEKIHNIN